MVFFAGDMLLRGKAVLFEYTDAVPVFEAEVNESHSDWFEKIVFLKPMAPNLVILIADQLEEMEVICDPGKVDFAQPFLKLACVYTKLEKFWYELSTKRILRLLHGR